MNEQRINAFFGDEEPKGFGTGWWAGVLATFFGVLALGGVLCLHFPQLLTSPELRPYYPMTVIRLVIQAMIVAALRLRRRFRVAAQEEDARGDRHAAGGRSARLGRRERADQRAAERRPGHRARLVPARPARDGGDLCAARALLAAIPGAKHVPPAMDARHRLFPVDASADPDPVLPDPAAGDLRHALSGDPGRRARHRRACRWCVQFLLAVLVADLAEWAIHLAFHKVPFLWRFHSIHHSSPALDWIAGSRSHFVDDTLVRGLILVPMMLAFSQAIILAYLVFVTLHATWTHCNFGPNVKWLEPFPGHAALSPLASLLAEGSDRQEFRDPLPVDRPPVRHPLLSRRLAGELRHRGRGDPARLLGARPSIRSSSRNRRVSKAQAASATCPPGSSRPCGVALTRPSAFIALIVRKPKSYSLSLWLRRSRPG